MNFEELIRERNEDNPYAKYLGIQTLEIEPGYARGTIKIKKEHTNVMGAVHGGLLFSLADAVAGSAAQSHGDKTVTVTSDVKFLRGAFDVDKLDVIVTELKNGRSFSFYEAKIFDEEQRLIFQGSFQYYKVKK
ncbi:MAG: PaaI family thioesterase [Tissierellia bacterium]|nr:PaaI family thioesterase [Tissierellia bacterium]